jgi:hypothetical protein
MSKITYANKVAINENPEISDIHKVTDNDMNEIKAVVNNNDDDMTTISTNLTNATTYSTSETVVGTWIDSKPIYRKVIANEVDMTNGSEISLSSVSNMDNLVSIQSKEVNVSNNFVFYNNYYDSSTNKFNLFHYIARNSLYLYAGSGIHYTVTVTIEYTKTTD